MKGILKELRRLKTYYEKYPDLQFDSGVAYGLNLSISVIKNHLKKVMGDSYIDIYGKDELFK